MTLLRRAFARRAARRARRRALEAEIDRLLSAPLWPERFAMPMLTEAPPPLARFLGFPVFGSAAVPRGEVWLEKTPDERPEVPIRGVLLAPPSQLDEWRRLGIPCMPWELAPTPGDDEEG